MVDEVKVITMGELSEYQLFSRPGFLEGIGRIIDFWGFLNQYRYSETPEEADRMALASDWKFVAKDMNSAIQNY